VLAGGLGTRIRSVLGDTPKVLAPINGRPFLDVLLAQLASLSVGRVVMSLGHLAERVTGHLARAPQPLPVETVVEPQPLGTAGALRLVAPRLSSDPVLVMNGDTWLKADFGAFLAAHQAAGAAVSLLCVHVDDVSRYGRVEFDGQGRLTRFAEKGDSGPGWINGGAVLVSRAALAELDALAGPSLERDFLARLPAGQIHCHLAEGAGFIDIGTPESLAQAGDVIGEQAK
jgi:mannose-1-phosphate guanylyltransferase